MSYFPHAFQKMLVAKNGFLTAAGTASISLGAGVVGLFNAQTNLSIVLSGATSANANPLAYLAQGSLHTVDKIGPFLGGYQESVKSKLINPKYVSKFYVSEPLAPAVDILSVTGGTSTCTVPCNVTYRLRVDIKGSPALRFLTHNAYLTVDAYTGCCTQTVSGTNDFIDPTVVYLQWAWQIENSPIISQFIKPTVYNRVYTTAPGTFATATAAAASALTFSATTNLAAGQRVLLTPTAGSAGTGVIAGNTLTLSAVTANSIFSVGQTITGTGVAPGTKIIALVSGGGGATSVFTVNISQSVASTVITSADPIIAYIDSAWTTGAATLKAATNWYTPSTTTVDVFSFSGTPAVWTKVPTTRNTSNLFAYTFATGSTAPQNVISSIELQGAYVDTVFGDCSFNPMDHTEFQPIDIIPTFVDYTGNPCTIACFSVTEIQQGLQGRGFGETIARQLILAKRYTQEPWQQDVRKREIENDTTLTDITRGNRYFSYHLLHSVPRKANPSGIFDADQYLIKIPASSRDANFELGILTWLNAAGNYDCGVAASGIQNLP